MARPLPVLLGCLLLVGLLAVVASLVPAFGRPLCGALGRLGIDAVPPGCVTAGRTRTSVAAGRAAMERRAFREALGHFRAAAATPDAVAAHLGRGEAAQTLGEYAEALAAYRAAAAAEPSVETQLRVGDMAERLGQTDVALRAFERAFGTERTHRWTGVKVATLSAAACVSTTWSSPTALWHRCLPGTRTAWRIGRNASRDAVPQHIFHLLVESDQRQRALAFARERGWVRDDVDYCGVHTLALRADTSALVAMLAQPARAECLVPIAVAVTDGGGARLARRMLLDRIEHSSDPGTRTQAADLLRYRLPAHDVSKLAESLNATGWRLQEVHDSPDEALAVLHKAIEADARFSWPYHNIARLYLARDDNEQALAWLAKALEVNPDHWRAQFNYGVAAARLRRYPDALAAYERALAMHPGDADAYANIGWTLIELGREDEGTRALQTAVKMDGSLTEERDYLNARFGRDARGGPTPFSTR